MEHTNYRSIDSTKISGGNPDIVTDYQARNTFQMWSPSKVQVDKSPLATERMMTSSIQMNKSKYHQVHAFFKKRTKNDQFYFGKKVTVANSKSFVSGLRGMPHPLKPPHMVNQYLRKSQERKEEEKATTVI